MNASLDPQAPAKSPLGDYLRDRRLRLDPLAVGLSPGGRRTPGLRREEVAQRANISTTWYVSLEQGRGGPPSPDVLDRLARALLLGEAERQHLFLLGLGRPPGPRFRRESDVEPRLQHVLDALNPALAFIRTAIWDVVAWNEAVATVMIDYAAIPPERRNFLRFVFLYPAARTIQHDWEGVARAMVATFRAETARAGALSDAAALVDELSRLSPDFRRMWRSNDVLSNGGTTKLVLHPVLGPVTFECSAFAVDGRQDLSMVVFHPTDENVADRISAMLTTANPSAEGGAPGPRRAVAEEASRT